MKPIHVWAYLDELATERREIDQAIAGVLESGQLVLGPRLQRFEEQFSAYCQTAHGIGVNSGTDALFLALRALDLQPGDEVITVANTAVPTISAIVSAAATPRFVDIDARTYLMNTEQLAGAITSRTRCILPVHLFGQCANMTAIQELAERHDLAVIEDCAQAHGASQAGRKAGSMSRAAAFSFYPTKILGAFGDGGMIVTSDSQLSERLRRLRFYGMQEDRIALEHGYNTRLDELQAAILNCKLARIDESIRARRRIAERYTARLDGAGLTLPATAEHNEHVYYLYVVRHPERDRILDEMRRYEVYLNVSYRDPVHSMPAYSEAPCVAGGLPQTERAAREIFSLPMYPSLTEEDQERVCSALLTVLGT